MVENKNVPIVFSFDDNLVMPAGVCITSLLVNSDQDVFYDIFVLHNISLSESSKQYLSQLYIEFKTFKITYIDVGELFIDGYEVRGISIAAYYRLLIPEFIPQYDKILYSDVDVIFKEGLFDIYSNVVFENEYLAGVKAVFVEQLECKYILKINCIPYKYINSGFLIFNSKLMRENDVVNKFKSLVGKKYLYQDQDIINIVCKDKIKYLPPRYTFSQGAYKYFTNFKKLEKLFSEKELSEAYEFGIVHYNGVKPWDSFCYRYDLWWFYYKKSIFFKEDFYINVENNIINKNNYSFWSKTRSIVKKILLK
jgi:lipopolysaccharide biosynthesis glycosyltransferase